MGTATCRLCVNENWKKSLHWIISPTTKLKERPLCPRVCFSEFSLKTECSLLRCFKTSLQMKCLRSTVPVQCTDHDELEIVERSLDGTYIHKTTGGLQLKRAYMVYMYE